MRGHFLRSKQVALYTLSKINLLLMKRFPILCRRNPLIALEQLHEIFLIRETACICNFINRQGAVGEQILRDGDPDPVNIGQDRITGIFLKYIRQIGWVVAELFCNVSHGEWTVVVSADPLDDIQDISWYAGIQKVTDLKRFVSHFQEEQIEGIVAFPGCYIVFSLVDIEQLDEQQSGPPFQRQSAIFRQQKIFRGGVKSEDSVKSDRFRRRLPRL